jgi:hypothetical protein
MSLQSAFFVRGLVFADPKPRHPSGLRTVKLDADEVPHMRRNIVGKAVDIEHSDVYAGFIIGTHHNARNDILVDLIVDTRLAAGREARDGVVNGLLRGLSFRAHSLTNQTTGIRYTSHYPIEVSLVANGAVERSSILIWGDFVTGMRISKSGYSRVFRKWDGIAMPQAVFALLKKVRDNVEAKLERTPYFRWVAARLIVGDEKEKSKYENTPLASIASNSEFSVVVEELSRRYTDQSMWRETIRTSKYTTLVTEIRSRRVATPRDIPFELSSTMVYSGLPASTPQNLGAAWWEEGIERIRNRDPSIPVHIYVYAISMIHKLDRVHGNEDVYSHVKRVVGYVYNITGPHARGEMDKLPAKTIAYLFDQIVATKQINIEEWDEQTWKSDYKSIEQHLKSASDPSVDEKKLIDDISKNVGYLDMYIIATGKVDNVSNEIRYGKVTNLRYAVGYFYITSCWVDILTSFDRLVKLQKDPNRAERLAYEARDSAWQHERDVASDRSNNDAISMLTSPSQPPGTRPPAAAAATTTTTTTVPGLGRQLPPLIDLRPSSAATATGLRPPPTRMVPSSAATATAVFGLGRQLPLPTATQERGATVPSPAATQMRSMFDDESPGFYRTPQQFSTPTRESTPPPQNPRARGMSGFVYLPD